MANQRLLLYFSLILVLYLIWQAWEQDYGRPAEPEPPAKREQAADAPDAGANGVEDRADVPAAGDLPAEAPEPESPQADEAPRIRVVTDVLDLEISTRGGDLRAARLLNYPVDADAPEIPFELLHETPVTYVAQSGLVHAREPGQDAAELAPNHHARYRAERSEYRLDEGADTLTVPLVWEGGNGVTVTKTYTFRRDDYLVEVDHRVENRGDEPWIGRQYRQLRHGTEDDDNGLFFIYTYTGGAYYDGSFETLDFDAMAEGELEREITGGWAAMMEHYFVTAWVPDPEQPNDYYSLSVGDSEPEYILGLRSPPLTAEPGETVEFQTHLYAGPKLQERLDAVADGLELTVDYGIFTVIAKPLYWLLDWIHSWVGNWGVAIIIVTFLIKLAFYKPSEISYRSMARMRKLQPRLQALRERYADDKQRLNQALMDMYKKEKINPLGGCLPIVIQIPVFIALYWVLLESVELRQAPFMLWIDDLSSKDPYFVLPILMGVTMYVQQKLNPAPLDPMQAKVFMLLPFIFTAFFAFFPAGLVLYWLVNNLLSIGQQWVITRRIESGTED